MIPVIFDTNIYGKIAADEERDRVIDSILKSRLVVLNFSLIREELRKTARGKVFKTGKKVRMSLLEVYDRIAAKTIIPVTKEIGKLADQFYKEYKRIGGNVGKRKILDDFKIVACATLKGCDVISSDDKKTMQNPKSIEAYAVVAVREGYRRPPGFMSYVALTRAVNERFG